jgi:splicing factor 3A subunit 1
MPEEAEGNAGVGLILPPPDIRGVIDKTAQFVGKCGPEFEQRVLREQNHTKFAFLLPNNPYRAYYEAKVKEFKTGVVEEAKPAVPKEILEQKAKDEEKKRKKEQLKTLTMGESKKKRVVKPPPPDQYVVSHPYIAPMDMDIIKLTAQFVARNGQKFLIGLTQRESRNPQFDFLKPTHALFGYFTSLVDAYTKCLMPNKDEVEKLKKCASSSMEVLDKAMQRYYWDEQEESQRRSKEEEEKHEKDQMQMIDWHEFVLVETIEFTQEDENIPLAAPIDVSTGAPQGAPVPLDQGGAGTVFQEAHIEKPKGIEEDEPEEAAVDLEKEEREKKEREQKEKEKEKEERDREEREKEERDRLEKEREEEEMAAMPEEEPMEMEPEIPMPSQDSEMKVRKDYIRHKKATAGRMMQRCPITGQLIPAEEMSNHLKVLLLDPKWKHQKDALVERARKESAFADDVEANLAGFVAKRPDLFGSVDEQIREAAEAGAEAAARDAGADAGPAHTMVPPTQAALTSGPKPTAAALTAGGGGSAPGLPAPLTAGPITGVSTINSRLPGAQNMPSIAAAATVDDEDEDDATANKPNPALLVPEGQWISKHPQPIQLLVQVNLGADATAASVPSAIPMELLVRTKVSDMKQQLVSKVSAAGVNIGTMKLKVQSTGYILKNERSLAFYNLAPGSVVELTKKQRGGQ